MRTQTSSQQSHVCLCDACGVSEPLSLSEVYSISPRGGLPKSAQDVYMLLCRKKFAKLYTEHGNQLDEAALQTSNLMAVAHLHFKGKIRNDAGKIPRVGFGRMAKRMAVCCLVVAMYVFSAAPVRRQWGADPSNAINRFYWPVAWLTESSPLQSGLTAWADFCERVLSGVDPPPMAGQKPITSESGNTAVETTATDHRESVKTPPLDPEPRGFRLWTDHKGRTVEARFIESSAGKVTFELRSGKSATIAIEKLSEADQQFVTQVMADLKDRRDNTAGKQAEQ